ncbi:zinc-dependent alcohol dehydrogenase family protein [Halomicronema sp. CCY15110]|uniref:zinc-dependent alcohol dehydrogenase family protein n=1 Tax=Halomicronema sp. CCY15110 TaxID=2767773 RepID=UPI001951574D|nr:zinc-dependent alcohol dehydrogenase family protein [Halomicronema sp. CCY15110]
MKACIFKTPGATEVLTLAELPLPTLRQDTDILVKLKAAGVNPIDTKIRGRGSLVPGADLTVLGCDGAGVVETVGDRVRHFSPGDEVFFCSGGLGGDRGNYAEYAVVSESDVVLKPARLSFAEAAAAPLVLLTAWEALYDRARLAPHQRVLIHAGAGGVGHVAIQLAKLREAQVATTISSEDKARFATHLGADHCIYYNRMDFVQAVMAWTDNQGVDIAFDTVGQSVLAKSFEAVKYGGDVVTLLAPADTTNWQVARDRNLRVSFELMLTPQLQYLPEARHHQAQILANCAQWLDAGKLHIHVDQTFPLSQAVAAHEWIQRGGGGMGKVVLTMD